MIDEATLEVVINSKANTAGFTATQTAASNMTGSLKEHAAALQTVNGYTVTYGETLTKQEARYATSQLGLLENKKAVGSLEEAMHHGSVALGEYGGAFDGLSKRLGGLQGLLGGGLAFGAVGIAGAATAGAALEVGRAMIDNSEAQARADASLAQAATAAGRSIDSVTRASRDFIDSNKSFIANQYDAEEAMALFIRAGNDQATATQAMNAALDLATLKHLNLTDAARMVELAMMGNGRAVRELGIDLKTLSASTDVSEADTKRLEVAQKAADTASQHLATAQRSLREEEDSLHAKRTVSKLDLDHLKDKQDAVAKAQAGVADANSNVKKIQDELNVSQARSAEILGELTDKVKGGRDATTELEQSQYRLNKTWQDMTARGGPGLVSALAFVADGMDKALTKGQEFDKFLNEHNANSTQTIPAVVAGVANGVALVTGAVNDSNKAADNGQRSWGGYSYTLDHQVAPATEYAAHTASEHSDVLHGLETSQEVAAHAAAEHADALKPLQDALLANRDESINVAAANQRVRDEVDRLGFANELAAHTWDEHNQSAAEANQTLLNTNISIQNIRESIAHANSERLDIKVQDDALQRLKDELQGIFNQQYVVHFQTEHNPYDGQPAPSGYQPGIGVGRGFFE